MVMDLDSAGMAFTAARWPPDPGRPTLIFIHGAGGSGLLWKDQLEALADAANTVAVDLPGHGRSAGPGRTRIEDYASGLSAWVEAVDLPRPLPCGFSMGGAIALRLLIDRPERWAGGILVSTGARLKVMPAILEAIERNYPAYLELMRSVAASEKTRPETMQAFFEEVAKCPPEVALGDFQACNGFDAMAGISKIPIPVLVAAGNDDRLTPPLYARFLKDRIPGSRLSLIPEAGHHLPLEQPEALNRAIREFLGSIGTS